MFEAAEVTKMNYLEKRYDKSKHMGPSNFEEKNKVTKTQNFKANILLWKSISQQFVSM